MLSSFAPYSITATADEGGTITNLGTNSVWWKNDKTYTITANKHYIITSIIVDGKDIPIENDREQSYTFTEVMKDHTIHASFARARHSIIYDANTEIFTGSTPSTEHDAGTTATVSENGFARDGYRFIGWNTQPDGKGGSYAPKSEIYIDDEDIYLYAQWEKLVSVTFMDEDGTIYTVDGNVPIGGSSTPPIVPTRTGYTFAGCTGTYTDVQKDEVVVASWTPNKYMVIYEPNGGEGAHMPDQEAAYDEEGIISESSYIRHNYEFIGWNTAPDGTGESYAPDDVFINLTDEPDGRVYLYAQWEFYIQMPETGMRNGLYIALIGTTMVSVALIFIARKTRQK